MFVELAIQNFAFKRFYDSHTEEAKKVQIILNKPTWPNLDTKKFDTKIS